MISRTLSRVDATTALVFGGTLLIALWWMRRRSPKLPPGPRAYPIVGNLPLFIKYPRHGHKLFHALGQKYGKIFTIWMAGHQAVVLNDLDVMRECFVEKADIFTDRANWQWAIQRIGANRGILWRNGEMWKDLRAFLMKALKGSGVGKKSIEEKCYQESLALCEEFKKFEGKPFQPNELLMISVSNIICSILFGERFDYQDKKFQEVMKMLRYLFEEMSSVDPASLFDFMKYMPTTKKGKEAVRIIEAFLGFSRCMIAEHKATYDPKNIRSILDIFIQMKSQVKEGEDTIFTDEIMEWSISDLFSTGTDTTSTALAWQLLYLIAYPEVQEKCHKEIDKVLGREAVPSYACRGEMPYLQATMQEILRISNISAMGLPHNAKKDSTLGGYDIPQNTIVIPNIYSVQMSEKYWEKPNEFRPERWLEADGKTIKKKKGFITFGMGPRNCPGEQLTRVEQFVFLTTMLQRFQFKKEEEDIIPCLEGELGITLAPLPFNICAVLR